MNEETEEFEMEEFEKDYYETIRSAKNLRDLGNKGIRWIYNFIVEHEKRLNDIENKIYPKRLQAKRPQKMAILYHLGIVDLIHNLFPGVKENEMVNKKAELLSIIIDEDMSNIKADLRSIQRKDSALRNEPNYKFVVDLFDRLGLKDKAEEADRILVEIQTEKEKKGDVKRKSKK